MGGVDSAFIFFRPFVLYPLRILSFVVCIITITAVFSKVVSSLKIGPIAASPLLCLLPFIWILTYDTLVILATGKAAGMGTMYDQKVYAWVLAIKSSVPVFLSAIAIGLGHKIRSFAPFRENLY